ncbi:putative transmembrane adenylate cyclase [alpha proteobacterium BAL199]|jgi:adenylate cyclase|nr:putative transmembrane adenylate cyclase [alpha proteobacterium BAL199]
MDDPAALLREREVQGLRWFLFAMIGATLVWGIGGAVFITGEVGKAFVLGTGVFAAAINAALLLLLTRRRALELIGFATVMVAFVTIAPSPLLEWQAAGIDRVPAAYVIKTGLSAALVVCALSALTLRPRYPLMVTGLTLAYQLFLLALALDDPRTILATQATWQEHVMDQDVHLGKVAHSLGLTTVTGLSIALVAWVARQTVRRAVALEQANSQLRRYFSPDVAQRIAEANADFMRPGGRVRNIVVLVSDLAGFTPMSRALGPDATLKLLAEYQARMTAAIFAEGGSVDKFLGDGILATFGATGIRADAPSRAIRASIGMVRALAELNAERAVRRQPVLEQRIGLHIGPALVGNVGSADRLEFTVIGDVVNLASRIEQACKVTGDAILASRAVLDAAGTRVATVERGSLPLPGVENPPELLAIVDEGER